jgi:hypothetical protein
LSDTTNIPKTLASELAKCIRKRLGEDILSQALKRLGWRNNIVAGHERLAVLQQRRATPDPKLRATKQTPLSM